MSERSGELVHHYCKTFFPIRGGVEVVVDTICRLLGSVRKNVIVSTARGVDRERCHLSMAYADADVRLVKSYGSLFSLPIAPGVFRLALKSFKQADTVCVHYPFPLIDLAVTLFGPFIKSRLVVYWHSSIYSQRFTKYLVLPFTYFMLRKADKVVVATPAMLDFSGLLKRFHNKVAVLPYGLHHEPVQEHADVVTSANQYFVAIGRHVSYKGFDVLLHAVAICRVRVIILGDGPLFDAHHRLIQTLGIESLVMLIKDAGEKRKNEILRAARALVLPSVYPSEAFALVQLEAMRYGKPIINTRLESGVPWVARDEIEAVTVEPGSIHELAAAMSRLASDSFLCERLGVEGRRRIANVFNLRDFRRGLEEIV